MRYFEEISTLFSKIEVSDKSGKALSFDEAAGKVVDLIFACSKKGNKVIFIGNGGSASIASHMYTDFLKNLNISALAFNDPSLITCVSNDLGYEHVFEKPLAVLARGGDILFSISSSGKSQNILNATRKAKNKGCFVITLSGFNHKNPLRKMGDINFYLPSSAYGYVEIIHLAICHLLSDRIMDIKNG